MFLYINRHQKLLTVIRKLRPCRTASYSGSLLIIDIIQQENLITVHIKDADRVSFTFICRVRPIFDNEIVVVMDAQITMQIYIDLLSGYFIKCHVLSGKKSKLKIPETYH